MAFVFTQGSLQQHVLQSSQGLPPGLVLLPLRIGLGTFPTALQPGCGREEPQRPFCHCQLSQPHGQRHQVPVLLCGHVDAVQRDHLSVRWRPTEGATWAFFAKTHPTYCFRHTGSSAMPAFYTNTTIYILLNCSWSQRKQLHCHRFYFHNVNIPEFPAGCCVCSTICVCKYSPHRVKVQSTSSG